MARSTVPIELPGAPTADLHATTKGYVDTGLALKPGMPFIGPVPTGSTTPSIVHSLGTNDVDVTVYRVSDGVQVGVPADRVDADTVQLTFSTAPTSGQYRVVVSAGTGAGGPGGGGGGAPDPHAATHASGGSDPVTPAAIGAATSGHTHDPGAHDHSGVYAPVVHSHSGLAPNGGATGQVLTKISATHYDFSWQDPTGGGGGSNAIKPYPPIVLTPFFTDARYVDVNASLGTHFRVTLTGTENYVYFNKPTNPTAGQSILFECRSNPTTTCDFYFFSGSPQEWTYGDVAVGRTLADTIDYVVVIYDERAAGGTGRWRVMSVTKGFPV